MLMSEQRKNEASLVTIPPKKAVEAARNGMLGAFAMFLLGFGALNVFWHLGNYDPALPGLYDYKAATWGDGLVLSLGAGGFCALRTLSPSHSQPALTVGALLLLLGAAIQASWLFDQNISLNWTIPEPGRFNAPGLYHAAYFSGCFGFFGWNITVEIFDKKNRTERSCASPIVCIARLAVWLSLAGYLQMHLLDNWSYLAVQPWLSLFGAAFIFFVALIYSATKRSLSALRFATTAALLSCGFSLALCSDFSLSGVNGQLVAVVAMLLLFSFDSTPSLKEEAIPAIALGVSASVGVLLVAVYAPACEAFSASGLFRQFGVCLFCSLLLVLSSPIRAQGRAKRIVLSFTVAFCSMAYLSCFDALVEAIESTRLFPVDSALSPFVSAAIDKITPEWIAMRLIVYLLLIASLISLSGAKMHGVHDFESSLGAKASESGLLALMKLTVYLQILAACVGGMSIVLADIYSLAGKELPKGVVSTALTTLSSTNVPLFVGAAACCLAAIAVAYTLREKSSNLAHLLSALLVALSYFLLFCYVTEFRRPLEIAWWWAAALFPLVGSSLFIAEAFLSNTRLLWNYSCNTWDTLFASIISVGCFLTAFGSTIPTEGLEGQHLPTIMSLGVGMAGCLFAFIALPMTCTIIVFCKKRPKTNDTSTNSPIMGILQNGTATFALVTLVAALPLDMFAGLRSVVIAFVSVFMLLSRKIPMALFPLTANAKHLAERHQAMTDGAHHATEHENVLALSRHMQRQAILTALALMPWFLFAAAGSFSTKHGVLAQRLKESYLLRPPSRSAMLLFAELLPIDHAGYEKELRELGEEMLP